MAKKTTTVLGKSGYSGYSGEPGDSGLSGYSGYDARAGYSGESGYSGPAGNRGFSGFSSFSGISGYSSYSGISGYSGLRGLRGFTGEIGQSGFSGQSGTGSSGYSGEGTSGYSGYSGEGTSGYSGEIGTSGYSSYSGISGVSGYSGPSGYSGFSGEAGAPYTSGAMVHYQLVSSAEWNINHNLGFREVNVEVINSAHYSVHPSSIFFVDENNLTITFPVSIAGSAAITSGGGISGYSGSGVGSITAEDIECGNPVTGEWVDGIANITETTSVSDALFSLDELITAIAPAPAGTLTAQILTLTGTTKYSAKLPSGLNSDWYKDGSIAGSTITDYVVDNSFVLTIPDPTTRFKCGSAAAPSGILSLEMDSTSIDTYDISLLSGASTLITVSSVATYNSIWSKANAYATITQNDEGHRGYLFSHPLAGETAETSIRYDDVNTAPTFSVDPTIVEQTLVAKYLSGITYYGLNSILEVSFTAESGIFEKGYHPTTVAQITMNPTAIATNNQNPGSTPAYDDTFEITDLALTLNVASRSSNSPYLRVALFKPNGSTSYHDETLARKVCTYGTVSTTIADTFFDEAQRLELNTNTAWTSSTTLSNGNAQVRNGTLQYPNSTDYAGFTGNQEYQRWIYKTSASTGALVLTGITYTDVDAYGTGDLNVLIQLDTNGQYFDLGRVVGSNNGSGAGTSRADSKGGRSSGSGTTINWSIGTYTTADNDNRYRIIIIFRNTNHSMTAIGSS